MFGTRGSCYFCCSCCFCGVDQWFGILGDWNLWRLWSPRITLGWLELMMDYDTGKHWDIKSLIYGFHACDVADRGRYAMTCFIIWAIAVVAAVRG